MRQDDVVKLEDAPAYFTAEIAQNPSPAPALALGNLLGIERGWQGCHRGIPTSRVFLPRRKASPSILGGKPRRVAGSAKKAIVSGRDVASSNRQKHFAIAQIWRTVYNAALTEKQDVEDEAESVNDKPAPSALEIAVIQESAAAVDTTRKTIEASCDDDPATAQLRADETGSKARAFDALSSQTKTLAEFQPAEPSPDYKKIAGTLETLVDAMADVKDQLEAACRTFNAVKAATCAARDTPRTPVCWFPLNWRLAADEATRIDEPSRAAESVQTALYEGIQALSDAREAIERMAKTVAAERASAKKRMP